MKSKLKWIIGALVVLVIAAAALAAVSNSPRTRESAPANASQAANQQGATEPDAVAVSVEPVTTRSLQQTISLTGRLMPRRQVSLSLSVSGTVQKVGPDVGRSVESGQLLVQLDATELELAYSQAQAGLAAARATLAKLQAGATPQELQQMEAAAGQARTQLQQAQDEANRARSLYESGAIPKERLDAAETQLKLAQFQVSSAEAQLAALKRGARSEDVAAAKAQVAQAEASVNLARERLQNATLKAPFTGVVASRQVEAGEMANPGVPVYTVLDLRELLVNAGVTEEQVNDLRPGDAVNVVVSASGKTYSGAVHSVSPVTDQGGRLYPVQFLVANPGGELKPGMVATITLRARPLPAMPAVPREAVVSSGNEQTVYVVVREGDRQIARRRPVQLGAEVDGWVQVRSGLEAGSLVVVAGQTLLADGRRVMIEGRER